MEKDEMADKIEIFDDDIVDLYFCLALTLRLPGATSTCGHIPPETGIQSESATDTQKHKPHCDGMERFRYNGYLHRTKQHLPNP
ncbi:hypothetical protein [Paenibacillus baekrokdamisoli]|uniref:hypothetical protein n=1 Tax=Paenibacillus baekrokdamisoli TaxID=1712516 RepID=UPI001E454D46|nr:hypothetical protein [Paenibacillus baekrokdamisoli]